MNGISDINNSIEFVFQKETYGNRGERNKIFNDDLEYSIDDFQTSNIIEQLKKSENSLKSQQEIRVGTVPIGGKQQQKKRERKMIFSKPGPQKNANGVITEIKLNSGVNFEQIKIHQQAINSKMIEQVEAFPIVDSIHINRMNSPPQLPRQNEMYLNNNNMISQNRTSIQSIGRGDSFVINDNFNGFIGSSNNHFDISRDSKTIQTPQNIFDSRTSYQDRNPISSNVNNNHNILQQLKISEIKLNQNQNNLLFSQVNLVESQQANVFSKDKQVLIQHPDYINVIGYQHQETQQLQHHIQNNSLIKQSQKLQDILQDSVINTSKLSVQSNLKSSTNSSNLMSSDSLNRALGNLEQHTFEQPIIQYRIPQLFQQCHRLNSISINFQSPNFLINAIRHKQIVRNLIFQQLSITQVLQRFYQDLQTRQIKHNSLFKQFDQNTYLKGDWYDLFKIKYNIIKPIENIPKRTIDFNLIKQTLKNSTDALTYLQSYIQHLKVQQSQQFKKIYIDMRTSLFQIFNNLKKISEDLYVKSITRYLPQHFYRFYEFLQTTSTNSSIRLSISKLNAIIDEKQKILTQLANLKKKNDPLACSKISDEIQKKIYSQLNMIKQDNSKIKNGNIQIK